MTSLKNFYIQSHSWALEVRCQHINMGDTILSLKPTKLKCIYSVNLCSMFLKTLKFTLLFRLLISIFIILHFLFSYVLKFLRTILWFLFYFYTEGYFIIYRKRTFNDNLVTKFPVTFNALRLFVFLCSPITQHL